MYLVWPKKYKISVGEESLLDRHGSVLHKKDCKPGVYQERKGGYLGNNTYHSGGHCDCALGWSTINAKGRTTAERRRYYKEIRREAGEAKGRREKEHSI